MQNKLRFIFISEMRPILDEVKVTKSFRNMNVFPQKFYGGWFLIETKQFKSNNHSLKFYTRGERGRNPVGGRGNILRRTCEYLAAAAKRHKALGFWRCFISKKRWPYKMQRYKKIRRNARKTRIILAPTDSFYFSEQLVSIAFVFKISPQHGVAADVELDYG